MSMTAGKSGLNITSAFYEAKEGGEFISQIYL